MAMRHSRKAYGINVIHDCGGSDRSDGEDRERSQAARSFLTTAPSSPRASPSNTAPSRAMTKPRRRPSRTPGMPGHRPSFCDSNSKAWRMAAFSSSSPRRTRSAARPAPTSAPRLVAYYFKQYKPRAKILILDAKDSFFEQDLFEDGWNRHYPGMIEWLPGQFTGGIKSVDVKARTIRTAGETFNASVANVIPAQMAGEIGAAGGPGGPVGLVPDRSDDIRIEATAPESTSSAMRPTPAICRNRLLSPIAKPRSVPSPSRRH